jgi:hypothetical protein
VSLDSGGTNAEAMTSGPSKIVGTPAGKNRDLDQIVQLLLVTSPRGAKRFPNGSPDVCSAGLTYKAGSCQ